MDYCCPADGASSAAENKHLFEAKLSYTTTGKRGMSVRVLPNHEDLANPLQVGLIAWAKS